MKRERIAVLIIAAIAALSFAAIILHGFLLSGAETAVIYKNGEIVRELRVITAKRTQSARSADGYA